ncbi:39S ribosomal protein L55, mitochondrial [Leptopilina heterotoma]|uniref:39S ribosomal protein L55, mitochondrial n=1 Tax=Leptopilina heterotoma TaxID=63436 RepID=UPI001CA8C0F4|nr:39S ribosomal protein L55, mitochondrial [Leptopilina heterotoma]
MIPRIQTMLKVTETIPFLGRKFNCWSAAIACKHRKNYLRSYPVTLVSTNGSSINISYSEPKRIVVLPLNLELLTDEERKIILQKRMPKKKVTIIKDDDMDDFDEERYLHLAKR